jgi:hypothetical protein
MDDPFDAGSEQGVVVWSSARDERRSLRPTPWVVLEDIVLEAVRRDGQLVAYTSARLVAEHLNLDPGTAASALRVLRERGFARLTQGSGPDGRFGLAVYALHLPPGIDLALPCVDRPHAVDPHTVSTDMAPAAELHRPIQRRGSAGSATSAQGALDFGMGGQ